MGAKFFKSNFFSFYTNQRRIFSTKRLDIIKALFFVGLLILISRLVYLNFFLETSTYLQNLSSKQYHSYDPIKDLRGHLYDRKGHGMAMSILRPSIAINPRAFSASSIQIKKLAGILEMKPEKIKAISNKKKHFYWLKRQISYEAAEKIKKFHLQGLSIILEPFRYYSMGQASANLMGLVNLEHEGLLGLEKLFDPMLKPPLSSFMKEKDAKGRPLVTSYEKTHENVSGHHVFLTIDSTIQELAFQTLSDWAQKSKATSGFIIVSDPYSGSLLAVANYPSFDPAKRSHLKPEDMRNHAFHERFEPASVIKSLVIAKALEDKLVKIEDIHSCEKSGVYQVSSKNKIHDDHPKEFASTAEVLMYSSNICTFKIAQKIGQKDLFNLYKNFGISTLYKDQNFLKAGRGALSIFSSWSPIQFANIAFGQGFYTTGFEMLAIYNSIANGGYLIQPKIVEKVINENNQDITNNFKELKQPAFKRVLSSQTSHDMRQILQKVIEEGTGRKAWPEEYTAGGKTGTAQVFDLDLKAYSKDKRIVSFIGFAPAMDPKISIYVVLNEPKVRPYYGGTWAAPAFGELAHKTLKYLNVPPIRKAEKFSAIKVSKKNTL